MPKAPCSLKMKSPRAQKAFGEVFCVGEEYIKRGSISPSLFVSKVFGGGGAEVANCN